MGKHMPHRQLLARQDRISMPLIGKASLSALADMAEIIWDIIGDDNAERNAKLPL
jgi:hypothetical protein